MPKKTKEIFSTNLRRLIDEQGLKYDEAAVRIGISLSFLNQLMSGKRGGTPTTIDEICNGLKCRPADLYYEDPLTFAKTEKDELLALVSRLRGDEVDSVLDIVRRILFPSRDKSEAPLRRRS